MRCVYVFVRRQMILAADGGGILRKRIADEKCGLVENGEMGGVITCSSSINHMRLSFLSAFFCYYR